MSLIVGAKQTEEPVWDNAAQRSPGWIKARQGCLTGSRMAEAMDFLKSGKESEARRKLKIELLAERLTGFSVSHFVTPAMQHGIDFEDEARGVYQSATGSIVKQCGFCLHATIPFFGASPDGLLPDGEGLLELKCPTTATHIQYLLDGVVPERYKPQMLCQLSVTGRKYADFMTYDPRCPERQRYMIRRFSPSKEEIAAVEDAAQRFLLELEDMFDVLTRSSP